MRVCLIIIFFSLLPFDAYAGKWLDYLRKYDMNDYSLGLAVTVNASPYLGEDDNTFAYPYLTSFEHPGLTDGWFVVRNGELWLRRVTNAGWEFALGGRMQTLGFGNHESDALSGVSAPQWTIELGPGIGLRRWPIQVHLAGYFEPTNRHDGVTGQLSFSYPMKHARGYFVPSIEAVYQDANYTGYYYGVSDNEAIAGRPAYKPDAALNTMLRIGWAYALTDKWLLSGKLGYELLDDSIQNSPLVDRDDLWSVNLGIAYNEHVFDTPDYAMDLGDASRFDLRLGIFNTRVDSKIGRETVDGVPGEEIDLEDLLGESDNENVMQIDAIWRISRYHRLEASYFELVRNGRITLPEELRHGDNTYAADTDVQSRSHFKSIRVGYAYSLMRDTQKELGLMAGIHFSSFDSIISSMQGDELEKSRLDAPLPVFGVHGSVNIGQKTVVAARLQLFRTDYDQYEGSLNYFMVDVQRRIGEGFNVGLGYNYYFMKLKSSDEDLNGYVKIEHRGPTLFFGYQF